MILLQCKDYFDDILRLKPELGERQFVTRPPYYEYEAGLDIRGNFADIGKYCVMFYRVNNELWFNLSGKSFIIDESMKSSLQKNKDNNIFVIKKDEKTIVEFKYQLGDCVWQPLPFREWPKKAEEDYDFCLFIHNVLNDPEQRKTIYCESKEPFRKKSSPMIS